MDSTANKRIAVFLAEWELNSVLANTLILLTERAGYEVDCFLFHNHTFVEMEVLKRQPGLQVYDLSPSGGLPTFAGPRTVGTGVRQRIKKLWHSNPPFLKPLLGRARAALWEIRHACWHLLGSENGILPATLVDHALQLMTGKHYHCLIGIEKAGLVWAARVAEKVRRPFLYYSLELYNEDYVRQGILNSPSFKHARWAERRWHRKAAATIVQDVERARVLFEGNGFSLTDATVAYLPVSVLGKPFTQRSFFLHETLGIPRERKIILYFGHIREQRYALDVARVAQEAPEDWVFVMHGFCPPDTLDKIDRINVKKRVVLSLKTVPSDRIHEVIASADIGLAFYSPLTANERLTAFSSEKMALYMQCGVPFIAFDQPGYGRLANEDRCGAVLRNISELLGAVRTILASQEEFRQHAYQAFSKYYDFAANFDSVSQAIAQLGRASKTCQEP